MNRTINFICILVGIVSVVYASSTATSNTFGFDSSCSRVNIPSFFFESGGSSSSMSDSFNLECQTEVIVFHTKSISLSPIFIFDTGGKYSDIDNDGIPDWWEVRYSRSKTALLATDDIDGDGATSLDEFIAYTDPTNSLSVFTITISKNPEVSWQTAMDRTYTLMSSTDLKNWVPVYEVSGSGNMETFKPNGNEPRQFFKVLVNFQWED